MSFNLSAWSIKKPVPTLVIFLILMVAGWLSFGQLGIDANPNIDIPAVSITVTQPGAGPSELESQVTKKIEDAVAGLGNIDQLISTVTDGVSTTTINFVLGTNSDRATNDVRNAVAQIRQNLPQDINEPIVKRLEFAGGPIMTYAVSSERQSVEELSDLVDRTISRTLLSVPGVAQIQRLGGLDREISISLNPDRLRALGITATQVNDQIRASNTNLPGGRSDAGNSEQSIRTLGSARTVEQLKNYRIVLPGGAAVPLASVAEVTDGHGEARQIARFAPGQGSLKHSEPGSESAAPPLGGERSGEKLKSDIITYNSSDVKGESQKSEIGAPVVAFSVLRSTGSTLVTVEEGVRKAVGDLEKTLPADVKLKLIFTKATNIRESYEASIHSLEEASVLAMITILIFLGNWRATLITAISLPLSIVPTFLVFQWLGYTLNGMTLLAFALTVGNLVDDTVVEIENMEQHLERGKTPYQASMDSSAELGLAVIGCSATIIAVFLPVAFMGGIPGQFFGPFGITVTISTLFSTLVARTMTPLLGAYILKEKKKEGTGVLERVFSYVGNWKIFRALRFRFSPYRSLLIWSLRHRVTTLLIAIAFFIGSLQLVPLLPKGLFSSGDVGLSTVNIELPPGSTLSETDGIMQRTIGLLQQSEIVTSVFGSAGSGGTSGSVNTATIYANLTPREERQVTQLQFERQMRQFFAEIPGARISFGTQGAAGSKKDLSIVLKSENPAALNQAAETLERQMRDIPGLVEVSSSASLVKPEILIKPDPLRAADLGVSVQAIAKTASIATLGDNESSLAKFDLPDRQIPIRVRLASEFRDSMETIKNLQVPGKNNQLVPLGSVATLSIGSGPAQINRFNRSRQVSVEANLQGISLGDALEKVKTLPAMNPLAPGVSQESAGDAKIMRDIFSRFGQALGLAVLCIYAILVLLYNSFLLPLTILVSLPLSIGGALIGLLVMQKELGLFALIGIVLLMGLVTKNAILLVDYALMNQERGMSQFKAVLESGVSRLRPIMMTSISTIAGMVPIAMGVGAGSQTRAPMAVAVIGGFTTSTLLTLVVVPVLFTYIDTFQGRIGRLVKGSPLAFFKKWGGGVLKRGNSGAGDLS
ncbi:efflux RND transporter permease subunit [Kamptonema formosum]|uniref:efflux RND transporter permease subunit n=1 Tax=Kamptonema formosum TaxID=331992 RepID=UPI00034C68FE|nr:efflux RND transporter permease subunit [Oscillatoria sp. PCC 10802]